MKLQRFEYIKNTAQFLKHLSLKIIIRILMNRSYDEPNREHGMYKEMRNSVNYAKLHSFTNCAFD